MSDENRYYGTEGNPEPAESAAENNQPNETGYAQQSEPEKVYAESTENKEQTYKNDYNDFSRYNDTVDDTPKESPYSPYNSQNYGSNNTSGTAQNDYYSQQYAKTVNEVPAKKKSKGFKGFVIALVAVVVCVAVILGVYPLVKKADTSKVSSDSTQLTLSETPTAKNTSGVPSSEEVAAKAEKFNVGIKLYGQSQSIFSSSSSSNSLVGEGSGIIMGEDSSKKYTYIVTCAHVISSVKTSGYTMTVTDYEGNNYDGILVGYDSKTDVGVIKIAKTGLTAAEFGNSTTLKKGQTVYAIGNPGGSEFFGSFTKGMVSAIDRPISSESGYEMKCIQHTTPINSGNSGGALMNEYGQVIGINSSKIVSTGYEGMAFAIPISDAKAIIDDIIANGYVTDRPKLGISYAAAEKYQQYAMVVKLKGLPSGSLVIASISTDSSLANSKAKVGDLITAVNGEKLDTADVLLDKIENGKVGDKLKLELCRINSDYSVDTFTVEATLVEDKGTSPETETTTESQAQGGYDWSQFFGSGY